MSRDTRRRKFRGFRAEYQRNLLRKARCIDKTLAQVPADARAVRLVEWTNAEIFYLITRHTYPAARFPWRATRFDAYGPTSHFDAPSIAAAVESLNGKTVEGIGPSYASAGQFRFDSAR